MGRSNKKHRRKKGKNKGKNQKKSRPLKLSLSSISLIGLLILFLANFILQIALKPAEAINLIVGNRIYHQSQTWEMYGDDFKNHSTQYMTPEFLAAMAQIESGGNHLASPTWRWDLTASWDQIYAPASTSVGLFQFTKPTFNRARKYCVRDGQVVREGRWFEFNKCWFNGLYTRLSGSHSIEMASAFLHAQVSRIKNKYRKRNFNLKNIHRLAAIIHLCGERVGDRFVKRGFTISQKARCGSHGLKNYVRKMERLKTHFVSLNKG